VGRSVDVVLGGRGSVDDVAALGSAFFTIALGSVATDRSIAIVVVQG
jgi:hypothetical protein